MSAFSTARKIIVLGHAIEPFSELIPMFSQLKRSKLTVQKDPAFLRSLVNTILSLLNDISDDMICLSKLKVLPASVGKRCEPWSNRMWLCCIMLDMYDLLQDRAQLLTKIKLTDQASQKQSLTDSLIYNQVSIYKMMADLCFCLIDVNLWSADVFQAACGMTAGSLGFYKLWLKSAKK